MKRIQIQNGLDVLGDGHGCLRERIRLLEKAGYQKGKDGLYRHPKGRKIVYLNDEANKGASKEDSVVYGRYPSVAMMVMMMRHVQENLAYAVTSNNNEKICNYLNKEEPNTKQLKRMKFAIELKEMEKEYDIKEIRQIEQSLFAFCSSLPSYLIIEGNQGDELAIVSHAGIMDDMIGKDNEEIRRFCAWGGKGRLLLDWINAHKRSCTIIWGHMPHPVPLMYNNTINIDTGGFMGNSLTMLRYPEMIFLSEPVSTSYQVSCG